MHTRLHASAAELLASATLLRLERLALRNARQAPGTTLFAPAHTKRAHWVRCGGKPNPSLNRTRYGSRRKPALRQSYYRRSPGLRRLPPQAG